MTLWRILGREKNTAGMEARWRNWFGDKFGQVSSYLEPSRALVTKCPCGMLLSDCQQLLSPGELKDELCFNCPHWELEAADLVVWHLKMTCLLRYLRLRIGCIGDVEELAEDYVWRLGDRDGVPVYFVRPPGGVDYTKLVNLIHPNSRHESSLVLVPLPENMPTITGVFPQSRGLHVVSCEELFEVKDDGEIECRPEVCRVRLPSKESAVICTKAQKPVAVAWGNGDISPRKIWCMEELVSLQAKKETFDHFVDATLKRPRCSTKNAEGNRTESTLTAGQTEILLMYLIYATEKWPPARPQDIRTAHNREASSRRRSFYAMRKQVEGDATEALHRQLFVGTSAESGRQQGYVFDPNTHSTYSFIFRWSDVQGELKRISRLKHKVRKS